MTIAPAERLALHRQLLQDQLGDLALMPLYWDLDPTLMLKGVNVTTPQGQSISPTSSPGTKSDPATRSARKNSCLFPRRHGHAEECSSPSGLPQFAFRLARVNDL